MLLRGYAATITTISRVYDMLMDNTLIFYRQCACVWISHRQYTCISKLVVAYVRDTAAAVRMLHHHLRSINPAAYSVRNTVHRRRNQCLGAQRINRGDLHIYDASTFG